MKKINREEFGIALAVLILSAPLNVAHADEVSDSLDNSHRPQAEVSSNLTSELEGESTTSSRCDVPSDCSPTSIHLSNQSSDPFLFLGEIVNNDHARWEQYREAISSFSSVQDCLTETTDVRHETNLYEIDWQIVGTERGAEVCLFRIFRSLPNQDSILRWLDFHGFAFGEIKRVYSESYVPRRSTDRLSVLTAHWTVEQYREKGSSFLADLGIELIERYQLVIGFDAEGEVSGVQVVTPKK